MKSTKEQSAWQAGYRKRNREILRQKSHAFYHANKEIYRVGARRRRGALPPTRPAPELCECCGEPPNAGRKVLCLDHDHLLGTFRGWICVRCNVGLAKLGDCVEGVTQALEYLKRVKNG